MSCPAAPKLSTGGGCPYLEEHHNVHKNEEENRVTYNGYLQLEKVLSSQKLSSEAHGELIPEEHMFIILHQTAELWFKQVIYDIDVVRQLFGVNQSTNMMKIVQCLDRIIRIMKVLNEQFTIVETMTAPDFIEFRKYLGTASGFDSLQFRLLENKLGLTPGSRGTSNELHYRDAFHSEHELKSIDDSETTDTLLKLVERWLENVAEIEAAALPESLDCFWTRYQSSVDAYINDMFINAQEKEAVQNQEAISDAAKSSIDKTKESFKSLINAEDYLGLLEKGVRHLSQKAMRGAMMISCYREQTAFSLPYQILTSLMDIDEQLAKWRFNHVLLVQRMLGSKQGSGGSSGYYYLRSTLGDRQRVFLDIFNLSSWILPRAFLQPITSSHRR